MQQTNHKASEPALRYGQAAVVSTLCFGLFTVWSLVAVLRGFPRAEFSDASNAWTIAIELLLAAMALLYLRLHRFDIASLYPEPTFTGAALGIGIFVLSWLIGALAISPFQDEAQTRMAEFSYERSSLAWIVALALVNGAFEEVFLLGVLVRGLRHYGNSIAIGLPLLVRVLYHLYQGPAGVVWVLSIGLTFSLVYLRWPRLWPLVFAHVLWDIVPYMLAG